MARELFEEGASHNNSDALVGLAALIFASDEGPEALALFERAAGLGAADGASNAGLILRGGLKGVQHDLHKARAYFGQCASKGNFVCLHELGQMEALAEGGARDCEAAVNHLRAVNEVGPWSERLKSGLKAFTASDTKKALWEYDQLARAGYASALHNSAWLRYEGRLPGGGSAGGALGELARAMPHAPAASPLRAAEAAAREWDAAKNLPAKQGAFLHAAVAESLLRGRSANADAGAVSSALDRILHGGGDVIDPVIRRAVHHYRISKELGGDTAAYVLCDLAHGLYDASSNAEACYLQAARDQDASRLAVSLAVARIRMLRAVQAATRAAEARGVSAAHAIVGAACTAVVLLFGRALHQRHR